jgi:hypothetical protein
MGRDLKRRLAALWRIKSREGAVRCLLLFCAGQCCSRPHGQPTTRSLSSVTDGGTLDWYGSSEMSVGLSRFLPDGSSYHRAFFRATATQVQPR